MQRPWEQAALQERVPQRPQDDPVEELQLMSRVCRSCHSQEAVVSPRPFPWSPLSLLQPEAVTTAANLRITL